MDDISSNECPVSLITQESMWLVRILLTGQRVHRSAGASMFGQDSSNWPAWWFDSVDALQRLSDMEETAQEAERRSRK